MSVLIVPTSEVLDGLNEGSTQKARVWCLAGAIHTSTIPVTVIGAPGEVAAVPSVALLYP